MRALVVYESMFGNTELVARQVADGLSGYGEVEVREVSEAPAMPPRTAISSRISSRTAVISRVFAHRARAASMPAAASSGERPE